MWSILFLGEMALRGAVASVSVVCFLYEYADVFKGRGHRPTLLVSNGVE